MVHTVLYKVLYCTEHRHLILKSFETNQFCLLRLFSAKFQILNFEPYQLARVGTSKHTPGAYVCVSSEAWTTVGENCVELCSSGCRPASVGQL